MDRVSPGRELFLEIYKKEPEKDMASLDWDPFSEILEMEPKIMDMGSPEWDPFSKMLEKESKTMDVVSLGSQPFSKMLEKESKTMDIVSPGSQPFPEILERRVDLKLLICWTEAAEAKIICTTESGAAHTNRYLRGKLSHDMLVIEATQLAKSAICYAAYGAFECGDFVSVYHINKTGLEELISSDNIEEWQLKNMCTREREFYGDLCVSI
ncbi:OLC1v1019231C1 [Oldenlandia corymbosa var. corymbosa]|uniref:OLC1v1019231C1 n=1 Tax=Oldenlandia corymbosa var. corymbosa TaxID=529605 RepID=A0AAV1EDX4_OLDCO|nr:OLC1v1019231C1 [Oldenlandia corymbosa var. corymbosa]